MMGGKGGGVPQGFNPQAMQKQMPVMPMQNMQMQGLQMGGPPSMMLPPANPEIQMPLYGSAPRISRRPAPMLPMGLMRFI